MLWLALRCDVDDKGVGREGADDEGVGREGADDEKVAFAPIAAPCPVSLFGSRPCREEGREIPRRISLLPSWSIVDCEDAMSAARKDEVLRRDRDGPFPSTAGREDMMSAADEVLRRDRVGPFLSTAGCKDAMSALDDNASRRDRDGPSPPTAGREDAMPAADEVLRRDRGGPSLASCS